MKLIEMAQMTEDQARTYLEGLRWPNGPVCPRCGEEKRVYRLEGKSHRKGMLKCGGCRQPFSVTVGSVMESSHIPLVKWLLAFHFMTSSKKGMSAHQLHRTLGITYKSAWFMAHRIRHAMGERNWTPLAGTVEVDETFVGGKPRRGVDSLGSGHTKKTPVMVLVERDGRARAKALQKVTGKALKSVMREEIDETARIMTDESGNYRGTDKHFKSHQTVNHGRGEYARGDVTTNTAECFFSLVKRQHYGTNHSYSRKHLPAYIRETTFRWNHRKMTDEERRDSALQGIGGKRLTYRPTRKKWLLSAASR